MSLWERDRPRGHKLCGKCGNLVGPKKIVECSEMGLDESFTKNYLTFLCTLGPTKFHNSAVTKRTAPEVAPGGPAQVAPGGPRWRAVHPFL